MKKGFVFLLFFSWLFPMSIFANGEDKYERRYTGIGPVNPAIYHPWITYNWGQDWHPVGYIYSFLPESAVPILLTARQRKNSELPDSPLYFAENSFYLLIGNKYKIVPAPIGFLWEKLPVGSEEIKDKHTIYYYFAGTFMQKHSDGFITVKAPEGVIIQKLPIGAFPKVMHGATFYVYGNDYYLPVFLDDKPAYEVAKNPAIFF